LKQYSLILAQLSIKGIRKVIYHLFHRQFIVLFMIYNLLSSQIQGFLFFSCLL